LRERPSPPRRGDRAEREIAENPHRHSPVHVPFDGARRRRVYRADLPHEDLEQGELARLQSQAALRPGHLAREEIHHQVTDREPRRFGGCRRPSDERLDAREELGEGERLREVCVRSRASSALVAWSTAKPACFNPIVIKEAILRSSSTTRILMGESYARRGRRRRHHPGRAHPQPGDEARQENGRAAVPGEKLLGLREHPFRVASAERKATQEPTSTPSAAVAATAMNVPMLKYPREARALAAIKLVSPGTGTPADSRATATKRATRPYVTRK
jgi:hypothetical protein